MKKFIFLLALLASSANAEIRFNSWTNSWEGNMCMTPIGWAFVNWQPIGTICQVLLPNGTFVYGRIVNG